MSTTVTPAEPVHVTGDGNGMVASRSDEDGQLKMPASPLSESLSELLVSVLGVPLSTGAETRQSTDDRNGTSPPSLPSEGERWLRRLNEDDRIRVEEGIESILMGSLALAEKKCYDAAMKERRGQSETRSDMSPKERQPTALNPPPRHQLADTSSVRTTTESNRIREREGSTRSRDVAGNDENRVSQRRDNEQRRADDVRTRAQLSYDRDRKRPTSPTQDRSNSYVYASRDRYYGNAHGPQHLPFDPFHGPGHGHPPSPMHGYDNRPPPRDAVMPPPSQYHYGSYNPLDGTSRYRPPPPYPADYVYPVDNRTSHRDGDWNRRTRSPNHDRLSGVSGDRSSREERDDTRRHRDKASNRSQSSNATSPGPHQSRGEQRRSNVRDSLDHHSGLREGRASERKHRGRSPSPQLRGAREDSRPSERERQSEHNHRTGTSSDGARRASSPHSASGDDNNAQRRSRSREDEEDRKERRGSERQGEDGRGRRRGDNERSRDRDGYRERRSRKEIVVDGDNAPPDDVSPRSRKSSRRKRHRSRRSRSRSPSSEAGRHRKSSRKRSRRGRGESSAGSSSDDDESDRRGSRKHRHRSRRRRHRSRSDSGDESHAKKRSKKKRKDRRKNDEDDRRKGDGDRKESGRDREESDKRKDSSADR